MALSFTDLRAQFVEKLINAVNIPPEELNNLIDELLTTCEFQLGEVNDFFQGPAAPSDDPGTPSHAVMYQASAPGTYTNFSGLEITGNFSFLIYNGSAWSKIDHTISMTDYYTKDNINKSNANIVDNPFWVKNELITDSGQDQYWNTGASLVGYNLPFGVRALKDLRSGGDSTITRCLTIKPASYLNKNIPIKAGDQVQVAIMVKAVNYAAGARLGIQVQEVGGSASGYTYIYFDGSLQLAYSTAITLGSEANSLRLTLFSRDLGTTLATEIYYTAITMVNSTNFKGIDNNLDWLINYRAGLLDDAINSRIDGVEGDIIIAESNSLPVFKNYVRNPYFENELTDLYHALAVNPNFTLSIVEDLLINKSSLKMHIPSGDVISGSSLIGKQVDLSDINGLNAGDTVSFGFKLRVNPSSGAGMSSLTLYYTYDGSHFFSEVLAPHLTGNFETQYVFVKVENYILPTGFSTFGFYFKASGTATADIDVYLSDFVFVINSTIPAGNFAENFEYKIENEVDKNINLTNYYGQILTTYGDSITAGNLWQPHIIDKFGFTHNLRGIGGTRVQNSGTQKAWVNASGVYLNRPTWTGGSPVSSALTSNANSGQDKVNVVNGSLFTAGNNVILQTSNGSVYEVATILSISSNELTLTSNLSNTFTTTAASVVDEYPTGGILIDSALCMQERIDTIPADTDVLIFYGGPNDGASSGSLASAAAENTDFYGAYKLALDRIRTRIGATKRIICIAPHFHATADNNDALSGSYQLLREAIKELAYAYGYPCIDLREECGWNADNVSTYLSDTVHPNAAGGQRIAEVLIGFLKKYEPVI